MTGQGDEKRDTIPGYLGERSIGEAPTPPIDTIEQVLPFQELAWEDFERLCYRLARLEGEPEHVQIFGVRGQSQSGIDIYSRLKSHSYATYQCKRYASLTARDIEKSVDHFLSGEWAIKSSKFVFCVSASAARTDVARAIEAAASRLATVRIGFEVWDAEQLSTRLKALPDLVLEFFGKAWRDRFVMPLVESGPSVSQWDARLRTSRPCTVDAASWRALGIAPTTLLAPDANTLPAFVPRTVCKALRDRLSAALASQGPTVIVLQGQPASGKTRLAFEAIRQSCPKVN